MCFPFILPIYSNTFLILPNDLLQDPLRKTQQNYTFLYLSLLLLYMKAFIWAQAQCAHPFGPKSLGPNIWGHLDPGAGPVGSYL